MNDHGFVVSRALASRFRSSTGPFFRRPGVMTSRHALGYLASHWLILLRRCALSIEPSPKLTIFLRKKLRVREDPKKNQDNYYRFLGTKVIGAHSMEEMVGKLKKPRRVMMLVKAGDAVDKFIDTLVLSINLYFDLNY